MSRLDLYMQPLHHIIDIDVDDPFQQLLTENRVTIQLETLRAVNSFIDIDTASPRIFAEIAGTYAVIHELFRDILTKMGYHFSRVIYYFIGALYVVKYMYKYRTRQRRQSEIHKKNV